MFPSLSIVIISVLQLTVGGINDIIYFKDGKNMAIPCMGITGIREAWMGGEGKTTLITINNGEANIYSNMRGIDIIKACTDK